MPPIDPNLPTTQDDNADVAFAELVLRHLDGTLDDVSKLELTARLRSNPRWREQFVRTCLEAELLRERIGTQVQRDEQLRARADNGGYASDVNESIVLPTTAEPSGDAVEASADDTADPALWEMAQAAHVPTMRRLPRARQPAGRSPGRWPWLAAAVVAIVGGVAVWIALRPAASHATLTASIDAQWAGRNSPGVGARLPTGEQLRLTRGIAEVRMDTGVQIIVEGPAELTVEAEGRVRLADGRLSAQVPPAGRGFAVQTPVTTVIDLGTEFGVAVAADGGTDAVVFRGTINVAAPGNATAPAQTLTAGAAVRVAASSITSVKPDDVGHFIRESDIAMAQDPELLAYSLFGTSDDQALRAAGLPPSAPLRFVAQQEGNPPQASAPIATGAGIITNGEHSVFLDLDCSSASRIAAAGLLDPAGLVGKDGATVYLSWFAAPLDPGAGGYGGLSLMDGDVRLRNEYIFLGRPLGSPVYACHVHRFSREQVVPADDHHEIDSDRGTAGMQPLTVDGTLRRWVVKIEFRPGKDRISVYLDPPAGKEPSTPGLVLEDIDLQFDRLRLESTEGVPWRFEKLLVGRTYQSVTNH